MLLQLHHNSKKINLERKGSLLKILKFLETMKRERIKFYENLRLEKNNREKQQQQHGEISDILVTILPYFLTDFCSKRFAFVHFRSSLLRSADFSSDRITKANSRQCETSRIRLDFHWTIFPHDRWTFFFNERKKKKKKPRHLPAIFFLSFSMQ